MPPRFSRDLTVKLQLFLTAALLLPACLLPASAATTTGGYNITTLNVPNAFSTRPMAISTAGQIVGYYQDSTGTHGFLYQNGAFTTINCTNSQATSALAINDSGIIYGACGSNIFEYVISSGQLTTSPIQLPPAYSNPSSATITTISPTGEVFGYVASTSARYSVFEFSFPNGPAAFVARIPLAEVNPPIHKCELVRRNRF